MATPQRPSTAASRVFKRALVAPFYAVKVTGTLFHTQGGLDIDEECRVLRQDGSPFPNLLAAGGWRLAAQRAASRAMRCGVTSRATAC